MASDYIERMWVERADLNDKLGKLNVFLAALDDDGAPALTAKQIGLLIAQSHAMTAYLDILDRRLSE